MYENLHPFYVVRLKWLLVVYRLIFLVKGSRPCEAGWNFKYLGGMCLILWMHIAIMKLKKQKTIKYHDSRFCLLQVCQNLSAIKHFYNKNCKMHLSWHDILSFISCFNHINRGAFLVIEPSLHWFKQWLGMILKMLLINWFDNRLNFSQSKKNYFQQNKCIWRCTKIKFILFGP